MAIPEWATPDANGGWYDRDGRYHPPDRGDRVSAMPPLSPPVRGGGPTQDDGRDDDLVSILGGLSPPVKDGGPVGGSGAVSTTPPFSPPVLDGGPQQAPQQSPAMQGLSGLIDPQQQQKNQMLMSGAGSLQTELSAPGARQIPASTRALTRLARQRSGKIY